ncbi:MAG: bifunctional nuclease family protein [Fibrobacterota bacterium]
MSGSIEVRVKAVMMDPNTGTPVVVLEGVHDPETVLPIWIGKPEGAAILTAGEFENGKIKRPLTHDLIKMILDGFSAKLLKVEIDSVDEGTYTAKLYIERDNENIFIDARPSDSIALAMRTATPLFVNSEIAGDTPDLFKDADGFKGLNK